MNLKNMFTREVVVTLKLIKTFNNI